MEINQRDLFRIFKSKGLTLSSEATQLLLRTLRGEEDQQQSLATILAEIRVRIEKREGKCYTEVQCSNELSVNVLIVSSSVIDGELITAVVAELSTNEEDIKNNSIQLLDAFHTPKIQFDEKQKHYRL
jgi:ribosome-binding factor A